MKKYSKFRFSIFRLCVICLFTSFKVLRIDENSYYLSYSINSLFDNRFDKETTIFLPATSSSHIFEGTLVAVFVDNSRSKLFGQVIS